MAAKSRTKVCAFIGISPDELPFGTDESDARCIRLKQKVRREMLRLVEQENVTHFISGMGQGFDMYAAEIVLDLRYSHPRLKLECALSCDTQADDWTKNPKKRYDNIVRRADIVTYEQHVCTEGCVERRDESMVESADFVIAVSGGASTGPGRAAEYAQKRGVPVTLLEVDPVAIIGRRRPADPTQG